MKVHPKKRDLSIMWILILACLVLISADIQDSKVDNDLQDAKKSGVPTDSNDVTDKAKVVVGREESWNRGRVEEIQLLASAKKYGYGVQIQTEAEIPCQTDDAKEDYLLVFLPRSEGILTTSVENLKMALQDSSAEILLPSGNVYALIGMARSISTVAKSLAITSLLSLAEQLKRSSRLRDQFNAKIDMTGNVFYVLNDEANIGNDGLEVIATEGQYKFQVNGIAPGIILASPESAQGRSLLLSLSDYLVGTHSPDVGCVSCKKAGDDFPMNTTYEVMIGIFISQPQPFLDEVFGAIVRHGLQANKTRFFIYNQVPKYKRKVDVFIERLQQDSNTTQITYIQSTMDNPDIANVKNMAIKECLRMHCKWYVNLDSYTFINPNTIPRLLSLDHAVIAPAFRVQQGIPATFWRGMDDATSSPAYSWDHENILNDLPNMIGYWHSSCIRGIYAIRHDVLERLSEPYSHPHSVPKNDKSQPYPSSDFAFCSALRDEGIPMIATNAFPNDGILINITRYEMQEDNLKQYHSNPVMWRVAYMHRDLQAIMSGDLSKIKRPCHEVYEYPVFNFLFGYDVIQLAKKKNKWSPAVKRDPRKEHIIEPVPTVDQWLSQIGLADLFNSFYEDIFIYLQRISFPAFNPGQIASNSLIARFKPNEVPGLPLHHDSAIITFHMNLSPTDEYEGGEIEFPLQNCRVKPEVGHLLMFPSRLTHPKILHNVTEGVLHKAIFFIDEQSKEEFEKKPSDQQH